MLGVAPGLARGQAALTETFTAADGTFSFRYPAGLTWVESALPQPPGARLEVGTFSATLEIRANTAGETAEGYTTERLRRAGRSTPVTTQQVNGRSVAIAALSETNRILVIADPARVVLMVLLGDPATLNASESTFMAILASFRYGAEVTPVPTRAATEITATPAPATAAPTAVLLTVVPTATIAPPVNGESTLAFGAFNGSFSDIFLTNPGGRTLAQFTQQQLSALLPAWSPDGTMLAYVADTSLSAEFVYDLFVAPAGGGEPLKLSSQPSTDRGAVAWSPDSRQLIFAAFRGGSGAQIYKVNVDGTNEQPLPIDAQAINGYTLDWSPDGQRIALMAFPNGGLDYSILFARPDGSGLSLGPQLPVVQSSEYFKWSHDGQRAVISDSSSLTITQGDGSTPQVILDRSAEWTIDGVAWSPDDSQLAFSGYQAPDTTVGLYIVNDDGSNVQPVDLGGRQLAWGGVAWGSVVGGMAQTPVTPPPPTATLAVVTPCNVRSPGSANLRSGPGTNFDSNGMLTNPATALVTGQTRGSDGMMWWRVEKGDWVRSDVVVATGNCGPVPVVEP